MAITLTPTVDQAVSRRAWFGLAFIVTSQLMIVLDGTIVTIALPDIRDDLGFSAVDQSWVMNAYALTVGGLLLLGGRAGDIIGRRRALIVGTTIFTLASLLGGFSTTGWMLILARVAQGVGAALAAPTALGLIAENFPDGPHRARAISWFSIGAASGGAIGLIAGGVLTAQLSWHWVMFVNVPIGLAVLIGAPLTVSESSRISARFDIPGAIASTVGMTAIVHGFIRAAEQRWTDPIALGSLVLGAGALIVFALVERRTDQPLLPRRVIDSAAKLAPFAAILFIPGAMIGMFTFVVLFLQDVKGYDALATGLAFLPFMALNIGLVVTGTTARVVERFGAERTVIGSLVLMVGGLLWMALLRPESTFLASILGPSLLLGVGVGLAFVPLSALVVRNAPISDTGAASGLMQMGIQVGGALGLAVLMTIYGPLQRNDPSGTAIGPTLLVAAVFAVAALISFTTLSSARRELPQT
ncbi:MFS transporter [Aldersonia kunmingensis]|uniref:MFS transporter n=1 Tax=Aldersonia kunmingensis TaxID=408066 RepID=UPI00082BB3EC|nr:MFS transporter [Aldersonia kunmingensis]